MHLLAQASPPPTLPSAGSIASSLSDAMTSRLVPVLETVLPVIFAILVLFWAMNFVLHRMGMGGVAAVVESHQATRAEHLRRAKAEDRFVKRVEREGWELHFDEMGRMTATDPTTGRTRRAPYQVRDPDEFTEY